MKKLKKRVVRTAQLRGSLLARQQHLQGDVERRILDRRVDRPDALNDQLERTDAAVADDVEFALIRMFDAGGQ